MKLWIRSQERDSLQECTQISVVPIITPNKKQTIWGVVANFGRVGEYATRERCLEIIDEIQKLLGLGNPENSFLHIHNCNIPYSEFLEMLKSVRQNKAIVTNGSEFEVVMPSVITYEMPQE